MVTYLSRLKVLSPKQIKRDVAFKGKRISTCFNIKLKREFKDNRVDYHAQCPDETCSEVSEIMIEDSVRGKISLNIKQGQNMYGVI